MTHAEDLPRYRLLTGPDDAAFCRRVSEMLLYRRANAPHTSGPV
ncbi:DUF1737 domain-containing protein [Nonomuraea mesophila]|uniref:DUF1737 domain-containing protein n=1 Tax=Nonomuraea mesophila TaxID=2530382 RepID=A0A4R5F277_9ACTN|nr:DUF1737 domain-containing protein [Nonomuraea mesophila]